LAFKISSEAGLLGAIPAMARHEDEGADKLTHRAMEAFQPTKGFFPFTL
jgi:hypothetical protein